MTIYSGETTAGRTEGVSSIAIRSRRERGHRRGCSGCDRTGFAPHGAPRHAVTFSNLVHPPYAVLFCPIEQACFCHHEIAPHDSHTRRYYRLPDCPRCLTHPSLTVPAGAPRWVTPELLADTLRVWRPYYGNLTSHDALSIISNVGNLFDVLRRSNRDEEIVALARVSSANSSGRISPSTFKRMPYAAMPNAWAAPS